MNVFDYFFSYSRGMSNKFILNEKENVTFEELHRISLSLSQYLYSHWGENNNIILISQNSFFFITCYLAIIKSGNVCIPLNPSIEQNNFNYIQNATGCKLSFITEKILLNLKVSGETISEQEHKRIIQEFDSGKDEFFNEITFDDNRLAEILFTSGSTGAPKGVMLTHLNLRANTESILAYLKLSSNDSSLLVLPLYYCYGLSILHTHLKVGASIVLNNNFFLLGSVINDLIKYECTGFAGVPSHFQLLLRKSQTFKQNKFEHLRYVTQAGGKLHDVFINEFIETFPKINFYVMYGQTEATARLSFLHPSKLKAKIGSIGKAIPGVSLKIIGLDGEYVETGVIGEIVAKGDNVMKGYLNDSIESNQVLKNGWLHTGDLGIMDNDGFIYLKSRKKEIMKIGGQRISPKEIEEVIISMYDVIDCTVIAIEDNLLGEAIKAIVVINEGVDKSDLKSRIINVCKSKLSPIKIPQIIEFDINLNVNSSGKKVKA